jgi:hypothetical protein
MAEHEEISQMQAGVRRWVSRASRSARGLRNSSPSVLLAVLCAGAVAPVLSAAVGISSAAAVASVDVLSSVGANVLTDVLKNAIDRLRPADKRQPASLGELEARVAREIERVLAVGDLRAERLRSEIGAVLAKIDAGETVLQAAIESGDARNLITERTVQGTGFVGTVNISLPGNAGVSSPGPYTTSVEIGILDGELAIRNMTSEAEQYRSTPVGIVSITAFQSLSANIFEI